MTPVGEISLSGSKSLMNRALILASLARGESLLRNPSPSDDSMLLQELLKKFGVVFEDSKDGLRVIPPSSGLIPFSGELDIGPAGTVMRFLTSFIATLPEAEVILRGTDRMHSRPIGGLVNALRELGADIEYIGDNQDCPPLKIKGRELSGGEVAIDGSLSSQFLTSLLLVGARFKNGLILKPEGELVSKPYLDMTGEVMRTFGVSVSSDEESKFTVKNTDIIGADYTVEGDGSGASYFWGLAAVTGGKITVGPFMSNSPQGDLHFPELLKEMGCDVKIHENYEKITVTGPENGELLPITANMEGLPDSAQTLAVVAACAHGRSSITGLKTLRVKETDRIHALSEELRKIGVDTDVGEDFIEIDGVGTDAIRSLAGASIKTYDDHRMAMSFALLLALNNKITIEEREVVSKSFPDFWDKLRELGVR